MESERPIEKLLRACAEKRRHEARLPTELHPATRRLLQGEVVRQLGQSRRETSESWWSRLVAWPKLAWASVGVSALLIVTLVLLLPPKGKKPDLLAKNDSQALGPAPVNAPLAPARALDRSEADALLKAPAVQKQLLVADSEAAAPPLPTAQVQMDELAKDKAAVVAEAQRERRLAAASEPTALAAAPAGVEAGSSGRMPETLGLAGMKAEAPLARATPPPAAAPTQPPPTFYGGVAAQPSLPATAPAPSMATEFSFRDQARFAGTKLQDQVFLRTAARPVGAAVQTPMESSSVLASFRVQPAQESLVIVDGDGSVYKGSLQLIRADSDRAPAVGGNRVNTRRFSSNVASAEAKRSAPLAASSYSFHVLGTNKTLNQKVEFTGNFLPETNLAAAASSFVTGNGTFKPATNAVPAWLLNSKISGKAIINSRQVIEVNAAPVRP